MKISPLYIGDAGETPLRRSEKARPDGVGHVWKKRREFRFSCVPAWLSGPRVRNRLFTLTPR
jgi:hypothetical protein